MVSEIFQPHGHFRVRSEGNIAICDVEGPWNEEAVRDWAFKVGPLYAGLGAQGPCGSISVHSVSLLTSPQSVSKLREYTQYARDNYKLVAVAVVAHVEVEGWRLADAIMGRVYDGILPYRIFQNLPDALQWVGERVADATPVSGATC